MQNAKVKITIQNYFIAFSALIILFSATPVFAAELFFEAKSREFAPEEEFIASIFLNTENESINAIGGKTVFPENLLELKEIRDGNSIINFWVERPKAQNGEILFSGITPGGYSGKNGLVFSVVFRTRAEGGGAVEIRDAKVLLNDGEGTSAPLKISNYKFLISNQISNQTPISKIDDNEPPEPFNPEVASDPNIFGGKYFLVFATQDKGTGIDHYEVCEGSKKKCVIAESPCLLQNQKLNQKIFVKALDKSGNERIAMVEPRYSIKWYEIWWVWGIIILAIIAFFAAKKFKNEI